MAVDTERLRYATEMMPQPLTYDGSKADAYVTGWNDCVAASRSEQPVSGADGLPTIEVGGKPRPQQWFTRKEVAALLSERAQPQPSGNAGELPPFPNVQVPRVDADIDLMDIRRLAKWCESVAKDYARAALAAQASDNQIPIDMERLRHWLSKYGHSTPESLEEMGAQANRWVNRLLRMEPFQKSSVQDREDAERLGFMLRAHATVESRDDGYEVIAWPQGRSLTDSKRYMTPEGAIDAARAAAKGE